MIELVVIHL